ncbi:neurogenic differentiation factor 1-like [Sarcoptes scabiei]|nr:neurogenic differentiation factor 1-like [Sarcoptes scabiei]
MLSRSFRKVNHYGSDYWSQLIYWSVMITMIVLTSINSIRSDTICSETDFQASVALNECYLMLFKHQYLWLLDICNFKLVNIFLFDEIFGGCSQHHKRDYQDHSQQQKQPSQKNQSIKLDRMMNESVMILRQNLTTSQSIRSRSSDQQNLFVWKHFDEYDPNLRNINYLCMQLNNEICFFPIKITEEEPSEEFLQNITDRFDSEIEQRNRLYQSCLDDVRHETPPIEASWNENVYAPIRNQSNQHSDDNLNITNADLDSNNNPLIDTETIEIVNRYYHVSSPKGPKRYRLFGRNFYADISYLPSAYDPRRLLYEVKLIKLDRNKKIINGFDQNFERPSSFVTAAQKNGIDSNNITDSFIDSKRSDDDDDGEFSDVGMKSKSNDERNVIDFEKEFFWIQNVSTFVVLSNFEVIVFFHDEFCFINYFTSKCSRRSTKELFSCDNLDEEMREKLETLMSIAKTDGVDDGEENYDAIVESIGYDNEAISLTTSSLLDEKIGNASSEASDFEEIFIMENNPQNSDPLSLIPRFESEWKNHQSKFLANQTSERFGIEFLISKRNLYRKNSREQNQNSKHRRMIDGGQSFCCQNYWYFIRLGFRIQRTIITAALRTILIVVLATIAAVAIIITILNQIECVKFRAEIFLYVVGTFFAQKFKQT